MIQEKVFFKNSKGQQLVGLIDRDDTKSVQSLVVVFGSFNSYKSSVRQEALSNFFTSLGFAVFRFDYQGRGESEGDVSYASLTSSLDDAGAAIEFIKNQLWVDLDNIAIYGSGTGSSLAIEEVIKEDRNYKFLILTAPRAEINSFFEGANIKDWRENDFYHKNGINHHISIYDDAKQYDIYKDAKKVDIDTLILTASGEETNAQKQDKKLSKAIKNSTLKVLKECNNIYCADIIEETLEIFKTWLEEKNLIQTS